MSAQAPPQPNPPFAAGSSTWEGNGSFKLPFGPYLVAKGRLRPAQWEMAAEAAGGDLAEAMRLLAGRGWLSERDILEELAAYTGLPLWAPGQEEDFAPGTVEGLTYAFLKTGKAVPVGQEEGLVHLAVADPFRPGLAQAVTLATGRRVRLWLAAEEWILRRVEASYGLGRREPGQSLDSTLEASLEAAAEPWLLPEGQAGSEAAGQMADLSSEAPVIRLLNYLVDRAVALAASDIHLEPQESHLRVRMRIDGNLQETQRLDRRWAAPLVSRVKIMSRLDIAERRLPQDGQIMLRVAGRDLDLRVATQPTTVSEGVVLRLLYRDALDWDLEGLGMDQDQMRSLTRLIDRPHGLILVTGPTGGGKTTTLYSALKLLNSPDRKIITIEDPVEYRLEGVSQMQINPAGGLTFATGLRSILRQDPDIILVGEIRDRETADIAIHAALTGHLVFSTLHTNDAPGAVTRLQDMGVDSFLISSALTAVVAQRLVRRLCPHCRVAVQVEGSLLAQHGMEAAPGPHGIFRAQGCERCAGQGYRGRSGVFEVMEMSERLRELVDAQAHVEALRRQALSEGMRPLRQQGWGKALAGQTSLEEVLRVTTD